VDNSLPTSQPTLDSVSQTARLVETDPAFWTPEFVGPADCAAQQLIPAIDQRTNDENDILPVAQPLDIAELIHGGMRELVANGVDHPARTLRFGIGTELVWLRFG
jgi:hypothetical protein